MNTSSIYTFLSFITKAIAIIIVYGFSIKTLNSNEYSLFLLLMIMYRFKDFFDFGVLDNYSRKVSYLNTNNSVSLSILEKYKPHYLKKSIITFILVSFLAFFIVKSKDFEPLTMLGFVFTYSLLFSMYIMSNYFIGMLYGLNKIVEIRKYDFVFNLFQILVFFMMFYYVQNIDIYSIFVVLTTFQFFVLCRVYYFYKKHVNIEINKKDFKRTKVCLKNQDRENNRNDFIQYNLMSVSLFMCNWFISHYFDSKLTNIYFTLEAITDQIKNFSKIPFYLHRPTLSQYYKNDKDGVYLKQINIYLSFVYRFIIFGIISGFILVMMIFLNLDFFSSFVNFNISKYYLFMYYLVTVFIVVVDRFVYFYVEKYTIENDHVISHLLVIFCLVLFLPFFVLIHNSLIPFYSVPFLFSCSFLFSYLLLRNVIDFKKIYH